MSLIVLAVAGSACAKKTDTHTTPAPGATGTASEIATVTDTATQTSTGTASGTDSGTMGGLSASTLDGFPSLLDPVLAFDEGAVSIEADISKDFDDVASNAGLTTVGETGASLGRTAADLNTAFNAAARPSRAMCDSVKQAMKFMYDLGTHDLTSCLVKGSGLVQDEKVYAGTPKLYDLVWAKDGQTRRHRLKIEVRRKNGRIERLSFRSCSGNADDLAQEQYFQEHVLNDNLTIVSKMRGPNGNMSVLQLGCKVDTDGRLRGLKTIEYHETNAESGKEYYEHDQVTQSSKHLLFNGYTSAGGGTQSMSFYELIDGNAAGHPYAATKLAVGDGAAIVRADATATVQGWSGDGFSINESEVRIAKVKDREEQLVPPLTDAVTAFAEEEALDCAKSDAVEIELEAAVVEACTKRFEIDQDITALCNGISY